jgi:hypothetical protein
MKNLLSTRSGLATWIPGGRMFFKYTPPFARWGFWAAAGLLATLLVVYLAGLRPAREGDRADGITGVPAEEATRAPEDNSIAVMPFVNLTANPDQEYFSDGIAEELLNLLARIPQLQVAARTSSFSFKGKDLAIPESLVRQLRPRTGRRVRHPGTDRRRGREAAQGGASR